jgi:hypothetical protein
MMAAATASTSLVPIQPVFTDAERFALAGYRAGYRGLTREACTLDLRQFTGWSLPLFSVRRADIETFARELEARGRARATVTRRLSTIAGFYRYALRRNSSTTRDRTRPASTAGLRVARHRPGPQRGTPTPPVMSGASMISLAVSEAVMLTCARALLSSGPGVGRTRRTSSGVKSSRENYARQSAKC